MKVVTVVGARPQFIKAAVVSHELAKRHEEIIVHTGQHFDYNMSEKFFEELDIPAPKYNLGISGGTHAQMTGKMMIGIEDILIKEHPDWLLVYGDTNSTLAAALAASKLNIPICHVEAGNRTFSKTNPEEKNRICTDHLATLLCASNQASMVYAKNEGLGDRIFLVGNPMYDAFLQNSGKLKKEEIVLSLLSGKTSPVPERYYYLTCHREENTSNDNDLFEIFKAMQQLEYPTVYPVHPRNRERALRLFKQHNFDKLILTEPVGYLESLCLIKNAEKIVTDSGGLQTEAFFAEKKCITVLDFVCWQETMVANRNELSRPIASEIFEKLNKQQTVDKSYLPFGDGHSAEKIVKLMEEKYLESKV
ncbi:MAG TPA: UDP-N-acetylglucosamine 2-epimerase (non-hydrolyzing) [Ruminococcaceae bacterium]|nr:UDP-N-acetylglucosamine 2-epimerase (non-hydrolyzing) [Oscillospiraceae bacterium]